MNMDLCPIGRDLRSSKGFTMCVVARNELFLISDFLNHYRALGVERFIILDDRSEDGTREFLLAEPDVMVVESPLRYSDSVPVPKRVAPYRQTLRAVILWRNQLMNFAGVDRVHALLDVDEFLVLPENSTLQDAAMICRRDPGGTILGVMLDVYPRYPRELEGMVSITAGRWYFDALPHLRLRKNKSPKTKYSGARARLFSRAKVLPTLPVLKHLDALRRKRFLRWLHKLQKPCLIHWHPDDSFLDSHSTIRTYLGRYNQRTLLPLIHYKFAPPIYDKVTRAVRELNYHNKSEDYFRMAELLRRIENDPKGFMGRDSKPVTGWTGFERSGNAFGF